MLLAVRVHLNRRAVLWAVLAGLGYGRRVPLAVAVRAVKQLRASAARRR